MCGRYALTSEAAELVEAFDVPVLAFEHRPRYNIAPGQDAPVLGEDRRGRRLGLMRWGLIPSWAREAGAGHINARAESVLEKPSFQESFLRRRCLLPANGFYEWKRQGAGTVPFWYHDPEDRLLTFAGIWDRWARGDDTRHTFAILTTDANEDVRPIHDRMPVIVDAGARSLWLDREAAVESVRALLVPSPTGTLEGYQVSTRVNRPAQDDSGLVEPVG